MEELFEKHREFLVNGIDPDFGLLDKLLASKALTREVFHKIKLKDNTTEDKNRILLDFILVNKKATELVSALRDIGQIHLVNYLNADGEYEITFGDDWPLSESDISRLDVNRESLVDLLETSELCFRLFSEGVINKRQKIFICSQSSDTEKNEALLDILTKCSLGQYKKTITCLSDSCQAHVAKLLSDGGVVVRVHANLEGVVENVDELEEEIISKFAKVLEDRTLEEATRLLELTQLRIIAARKGQSIVIYIHCMTHNELLHLTDILKTDRLKEIIDKVFLQIISFEEALIVTCTLTWSLEEFNRAATYFVPDSDEVPLSTDILSKLTVGETPSFSATLVKKRPHGDEEYYPTEEELYCQSVPTSTMSNEELIELRQERQRVDVSQLHELDDPESGLVTASGGELEDNVQRKVEETAKVKLKPIQKPEEDRQPGSVDNQMRCKQRLEGDEAVRVQLLKNTQPPIYGLSVLKNEVFVSHLQSPVIVVYDSSTFSCKRKLTVSGLTNPEHIVSCKVYECLYTLDWSYLNASCEILRIDPHIGKVVRNWETLDGGGRLSVASDTNIILNINHAAQLNEYTADGELLRRINLASGTDIVQAWHALKLDSGLFVVCHGDYGDPKSRVCLMSIVEKHARFDGRFDTEVRMAFDGKCGGLLKCPIYLAVDKDGSILVCDVVTRRLLVLNSRLEEPRQLIPDNENDITLLPWRICVDEINDRYLIADYDIITSCKVLSDGTLDWR